MRVAVRCRLPGTFRKEQGTLLPALVGYRKHLPRRAVRVPRVVVRLRVPQIGFRAREWLRQRPVPIATPWGPGVRVAVLKPWFRVGSGARVFMEPSAGSLRRFGPGAVAGPVPALKELAQAVLDGAGFPAPLQFGVLAFTGPTQAPLTASDRELFWRAFQVPVFEQYRGAHGELLAYECEAHEGLHLASESVLAELHGYALLEQFCPCGAVTLRAAPALARAAAR